MPKAWNAGWSLVSGEQVARELLEDLEADRAEQGALPTATGVGVRGSASSRKKAKNSTVLAARPSTRPEHLTSRRELAGRGRAVRAASSENPLTTPDDRDAEQQRRRPVTSVEQVAQLARDEAGLLRAGSSKTSTSALRMPESQPRPE